MKLIGGEFCHERIAPQLLPSGDEGLTAHQMDVLWELFQAIGHVWNNLGRDAKDSQTIRSSWLEFIEAKTDSAPSYVAEYASAVRVVEELKEEVGDAAFEKLFLANGVPEGEPETRLAHAKRYVVDEFIHVNVVASGYKSFGPRGGKGKNYKGFLGGSRYNDRPRVRVAKPEGEGS